jgi:hypothetical protein
MGGRPTAGHDDILWKEADCSRSTLAGLAASDTLCPRSRRFAVHGGLAMRVLILVTATAALVAATPAFANPDWTVKSPIKVTPSSIPDPDGTIVKMVPGASSGRKPDAAPAAAKTPPRLRLERQKS